MKAIALALALTACSRDVVVWTGPDVRVLERGDAQHVVAYGRQEPPHAAIGFGAVVARAGHVAYAARDRLAWHVLVDGRARGGAWESVGTVALSPDGQAFAFAGERHGRWSIVSSDGVLDDLDEVVALGFTSRGERAVVARRGAETLVWRGARPPDRWSAARDVRIGAALSFVATDARGEHAVRDGDVSPPFETVFELEDDGFVARAVPKGPRAAFVHGARVAEGDVDRLVVRAGRWACVRTDDAGEAAIAGGREIARCTRVLSLSMSDDGEHLGVACARAGAIDLVVDRERVGTFTWASAPVFAPSGAYAYVASLGAGAFVRTSREPAVSHTFDVVLEDTLVVDDRAAHFAVVAGYASVKKLYVTVDGKPVAPFSIGRATAESRETLDRRLRDAIAKAMPRTETR